MLASTPTSNIAPKKISGIFDQLVGTVPDILNRAAYGLLNTLDNLGWYTLQMFDDGLSSFVSALQESVLNPFSYRVELVVILDNHCGATLFPITCWAGGSSR